MKPSSMIDNAYLSKIVPARRKTIQFNWIQKDWMVMSPKYREMRARCAAPMDKCFWCGYKILDGEAFSLACPEKGGNKVLCNSCADEASK